MRFVFTGTLAPAYSDRPYYRTGKTSKSGCEYRAISLRVAAGETNSAFVEMYGQEGKKSGIKTLNTEGKPIEVAWSDRFDEDVMSTVANYRKHTINIENEPKEFISGYDAVEYIVENMDKLNGRKVTITGTVAIDEYNGELKPKFQIDNLYTEEADAKNKLRITAEVFWTYDDLDLTDWKSERIVRLDGYTHEYVRGVGRKYVPCNFVLNCSKIDVTNEMHVKRQKFLLDQLGVSIDDNFMVKNKLKKNKVYKNGFEISYVNGNEEIEFSYDQLTKSQKAAVDCGLKDLSFFKPHGRIVGNRTKTMLIVNLALTGEFSDGLVEMDCTVKEWAEDVYTPELPEKAEDVLKSGMNPPEEEEEKAPFDSDDDFADLFDDKT